MKIWVIRHGESETNRDNLWTGWLDVGLTEKGRADAAMAGVLLSKTSFDKIYSSDLLRAKNTADIAIPGCKYETTPMLREINVGNIVGKPIEVITDSNNIPMNINGYGRFGGESKEQFSERVGAFMKKLESEICENVAVFSHAGVIRKFLDIVLGMEIPRKNMCCKNCTVAIFEYSNSIWKLHSWINLY